MESGDGTSQRSDVARANSRPRQPQARACSLPRRALTAPCRTHAAHDEAGCLTNDPLWIEVNSLEKDVNHKPT